MVNLGLNISLVKMGLGRNGIALGTAITYAIYSLTLAAIGWRLIRKGVSTCQLNSRCVPPAGPPGALTDGRVYPLPSKGGVEMESNGKQYSPEFKFKVMEVLKAEGSGAEGQIARACGVHPGTVTKWKKQFLEHGAEVFGRKEVKAYEKRIADLERMLGHKEVEVALLKIFWGRTLTLKEKLELVQQHREQHGLKRCLEILEVSKGT